jgi:hypothetical protein
MSENPKSEGWWHTVPGFLTALAGIITAVTGLLFALHQAGFFAREDKVVPKVQVQPLKVSPDCTPANLSELPPHSAAIIEPLEGAKSQVALDTLRYEYRSGLRLASGNFIEFKQMKGFELTNPDFTEHFTAQVVITLLDCKTHEGLIQSESGSFLTGETEFGRLEIHILKVKRVEFRWRNE